MSGLIPGLFARTPYADTGLMRTVHPDSPLATFAWMVAILLFSTICFTLYHYAPSLHDTSHYITAGVTQFRDHRDLVYVYTQGSLGGPSYDYFQDGVLNDGRINYPSKLYSALYGVAWLLTGKLSFVYTQLFSYLALVASNMLLYLIGRRFFSGGMLLAFLLSVALLPLMRAGFSPGNDEFGYLTCLVLIWMSLCLRINPLVVGLVGGVLFHFRSQSLAILFVLPLLSATLFGRRFFRESLLPLLGGAVLTYLVTSSLLSPAVKATNASNPISFYVNFFLTSSYGPSEILFAAQKFVGNFIRLFTLDHLFVFAYTSIICLCLRAVPFARSLAMGAWIYIAVPLGVYTFDRTSDPHARYYMVAVPLLVLAWFIVVQELGKASLLRARALLTATAVTACVGWYAAYGFPPIDSRLPQIVEARLRFLDFPRAQQVFDENFGRDDILLVNHSLVTGLSKAQNVVFAPTLAHFKSGDNHEISGLAFAYSDQAPNSFFRPTDWLVNGELPDEIVDGSGVTFRKIYSEQSHLPGFGGGIEASAKLVIYKNTVAPPAPTFDANGRRIRAVAVGADLPRELLESTDFSVAQPWGVRFERARDTNGAGVVVGPGPNSDNILYQRFASTPGERYRLVAKAASVGERAALGRLQVNWLSSTDELVGSDVKVFTAGEKLQQFSAMVVAPEGAVSGMIYVSPHGPDATIRYTEMSVRGK